MGKKIVVFIYLNINLHPKTDTHQHKVYMNFRETLKHHRKISQTSTETTQQNLTSLPPSYHSYPGPIHSPRTPSPVNRTRQTIRGARICGSESISMRLKKFQSRDAQVENNPCDKHNVHGEPKYIYSYKSW